MVFRLALLLLARDFFGLVIPHDTKCTLVIIPIQRNNLYPYFLLSLRYLFTPLQVNV